jgi:hypothetical protein
VADFDANVVAVVIIAFAEFDADVVAVVTAADFLYVFGAFLSFLQTECFFSSCETFRKMLTPRRQNSKQEIET